MSFPLSISGVFDVAVTGSVDAARERVIKAIAEWLVANRAFGVVTQFDRITFKAWPYRQFGPWITRIGFDSGEVSVVLGDSSVSVAYVVSCMLLFIGVSAFSALVSVFVMVFTLKKGVTEAVVLSLAVWPLFFGGPYLAARWSIPRVLQRIALRAAAQPK